MALSPIEMFKSSESSLAQILQGGSQTISGIMSNAIQIGRDLSNNQQRQETDLIGMRQNETALAQRRAENLSRGIADTQQFAERAFQADRAYGANQQQLGIQNERASANDLFSQNMQNKNYQLNVEQGGRAERQLQDQEAARKQEQARLDASRANIETLLGGGTATPAPAATTSGVPPMIARPLDKTTSDSSYGDLADQRQANGYPEATRGTPVESLFPSSPEVSAPTKAALDPAKAAAARSIVADPKASAAEKKVALNALGLGGNNQNPPTQLQLDNAARSARTEERAVAKAAETKTEKSFRDLVEGDTAAFIPQTVAVQLAHPDTAVPLPAGVKEAAAAYDANRFESEVQSAKNQPTADAYANLIVHSGQPKPSAKLLEKRRQLWNYANGQAADATPATATGVKKFNPATGKIE